MKKLLHIIRYYLIYEIIFSLIIIGILFFNFYDRSDKVKLKINDDIYTFSTDDKDHIIDLSTLNSEYDTIITNHRNLEAIKINGKRLFLSRNLGKIKLNQKNKIKIEIKFNGNNKYTKYTVNTIPRTFPSYEVKGESKTKGDFYLSTYFSPTVVGKFIYKINNKGEMIFYKMVNSYPYVFKKYVIDGKTYYTYLDINNKNDKNSNNVLKILDSHYRLVKTVKNYDKNGNVDSINEHDYMMISLNRFIFASYGDNNFSIRELKNKKISWEYTIEDYHQDFGSDETHFNSFELDNDNNLLVSFRDSSQIVKINRQTGKKVWSLGGNKNDFDQELFYKQHAITRVDDTYIVYNNNTDDNRGDNSSKSSVITFKLDEKNKKITDIKTIDLNITSYIMGGALPTNLNKGIYLFTYGVNDSAIGDEVSNASFEEKNIKTNKTYFSFKYKKQGYVFRVYKY